MSKKPKIVIVGAGFGGIAMAKSFKNKPVEVLLIDQYNYHNFQPLMYQVATGALEPYSIAYPVRRIFRKFTNVHFRMAEVFSVENDSNTIKSSIGDISFDYLIIATGSKTNYYNFESIKSKILTLKSIPEALDLRSYIFQNLEKAIENNEHKNIEEILNIAIIGGGPAGIEVAGSLAEMKRHVLPKDFPGLDISKMNINLYQSPNRLLASMSNEASEECAKYLKELGVNVYLNTRVSNYEGDVIITKNGDTFKTDTVIWTAGVKGAPIDGLPENTIVGNRVQVNEFNQVKGLKNIFAIGDVANCITEENPRGLPMLAPVAQQQGKLLSKNILKLIKGKELEKFEYIDRGSMATIGRGKAVVDLPKWKFQGTFAWLVWMFVHIMSLVGFRNKLSALFDWIYNYISYDRPLGLIIRPLKKD